MDEWAGFVFHGEPEAIAELEAEHGSLEAFQQKVEEIVEELVLGDVDADMSADDLIECAYLAAEQLRGGGCGLWEGRDPRHTKLEPLVTNHPGLGLLFAPVAA